MRLKKKRQELARGKDKMRHFLERKKNVIFVSCLLSIIYDDARSWHVSCFNI